MRCAHCEAPLATNGIPSERGWCDEACLDAWYSANPEEAKGWIRVEDLTPEQRAELDALIGRGVAC